MPFAAKLLDATHATAKTDRLLSAAEAASLLGLKSGTMYDLVARGSIPYVKLFGKTLRFKESAIQRIIADSEVDSTDSPTLSGTSKRKHQKPNGKATPDPSQRRRGRGPEAVN